jgi:cell division protein FtsW
MRRSTTRVAPAPVAREGQPIEQRILLTATLCLLAMGAVMVYSATSAPTLLEGQGSGAGDLVRFLIFGTVGLVVMHVLARHGIASLHRVTGPLLALSFGLVLLVHVPHIGVDINGGRRWIGPGVLRFEPAELMKLAMVLYVSALIARRPQRVRSLRELTRPMLLIVGAGCALVASEPDLGSAMVIAFTVCALLIAAGMPMGQLGRLVAIVVALVVVYAVVQPYARARLTSFINPWSHPKGSGFQAVQGQIAVGSGGVFGVGPGQSVLKDFWLPEASTDFILAVVGEELGVVGVCTLLSLYGLIAYAGLRAARKARSLHSALIAAGTTALIVSQALLNVFAVLGTAPLTGVPLPFVSYGSSNLIVMLAAMGLLMGVASGQSAHVRAVPAGSPQRVPGTGEREPAGLAGDRGPGHRRRAQTARRARSA